MMLSALDAVSRLVAKVTGAAVAIMAAVAMTSLILQVFSRYVLGETFGWTEELALFLFTWIVLLAGSLGVREGFHVRLTLITGFLPAPVSAVWERAITLLVIVFGAALASSGWDYVAATLGQVSAAVRYPVEWLHMAAPVAGAAIVLHGTVRLFRPVERTPDAVVEEYVDD